MYNALFSVNYVAVIVVTIAGFLLGWLWYSSVLFAKPWMVEMKITPELIKAANFSMPRLFGTSLILTLISTFALAWLLRGQVVIGPLHGAEFGATVGLLMVGARLANGGLWEQRSLRLQAINIGHEVALFALQGAILASWR
jgi:hypothetical protein